MIVQGQIDVSILWIHHLFFQSSHPKYGVGPSQALYMLFSSLRMTILLTLDESRSPQDWRCTNLFGDGLTTTVIGG